MKRISLSLFLPVLLVSTLLITFGSQTQGLGVPELSVTSVYWGTNPAVPLTAQPGDESAILSIVIANTGDDIARGVQGTLKLNPPFRSEYSSEHGVKRPVQSISASAGDIAAGRSFTFQFIVSIYSNATDGVYPLALELTYRSARELCETTKTLNVNVPIWTGELHIQSMATTPPKVYPVNKQVSLRFFIINTGRGTAKNVSVWLELHDPFTRSSTGSDQAFVGTVLPNQPTPVQFLLDIAEDADPGNYPIEVKAVTGGLKEMTVGIIDFLVSEKARFAVVNITPEFVRAGDPGITMRITVRNVGNVKAESVRIQLMAGNYFSGTLSDLLGTMNPGDSRTAFFTVDVDQKAVPQRYAVDLRIDWTQDEGYNLNDTLPLNITVKEPSPPFLLIAAAIIAAVLLLGYVRRRRWLEKKKREVVPSKPKDRGSEKSTEGQ